MSIENPPFIDDFSLKNTSLFGEFSIATFDYPKRCVHCFVILTIGNSRDLFSQTEQETCGPPTCKNNNHGFSTLALEQRCDITKHHDWWLYILYIYISPSKSTKKRFTKPLNIHIYTFLKIPLQARSTRSGHHFGPFHPKRPQRFEPKKSAMQRQRGYSTIYSTIQRCYRINGIHIRYIIYIPQ